MSDMLQPVLPGTSKMPIGALRADAVGTRCRIAAAMSRICRGVWLCCTCAAALLWVSGIAPALGATLTAAVPEQALDRALLEFSRQTGIQHVYVSEVNASQMSHAVPAGLEPGAALTRMLEGTGLEFDYLNGRIVRIRAAIPPSADPKPALEVVVITADKIPRPPHFAPATPAELRTMALANEDLEEHIRRAHLLYGNEALDAYVQGVAGRLLDTDGTDPKSVRVRVVRGADANAFSLSNGSIYVTTGLLATLQDESELAAVLGHEVTHFTNAHVLRGMREQEHSQAVARAGGFIVGVLLATVSQHYSGQNPATLPGSLASIPQSSLQIWQRAMVSGYSRDLEREADEGGIRRMIAAGYDASGALAALQRLSEQAPSGPGESALYASHPRMSERMASYRAAIAGELAASVSTGQETRRPEYQAQVAVLALDQVQILIDAGALEHAQAYVRAVEAAGDSSRAEYLEGEIARARIPQTDATRLSALAAYDRAVALPDPPAAAYRQAGLLHQLRGEPAAAARAFQDYLQRAPQAPDAPLVRRYLDGLRSTDSTGGQE